MEARFSLRLESGPDAGRAIQIPIEGITVGRRPENKLVLADTSVSGKHAELRVGADGVVLRDLGSTNGTFVGAARIVEHTLKPGEKIRFGSVQAVFQDAREPLAGAQTAGTLEDELAGEITLEEHDPPAASSAPVRAPAAPAPGLARTSYVQMGDGPELRPAARQPQESAAPRADASQAGEGLGELSDERLSRADREKRPLATIAVSALLLLAAGGAALWYRSRLTGSASSANNAPVAPAGNLLGGSYSFEGDAAAAGWSGADGASQTLFPELTAARSGRSALVASLGANEWALSSATPVAVMPRRALVLRAAVRRSGGVEARVGVRLIGADDQHPPLQAWSVPIVVGEDWTPVELSLPVLPGWDRAAVQLAARGAESGGRAAFDDVALLQVEEQVPPAAESGDYKLYWLGDARAGAVLMRVEQWIAAGFALAAAQDVPAGYPPRTANATARGGDGMALSFGALDGERELAWLVNPNSAKQGLATIGPGGYRARQREFEATPTTSVLVGSGYQMVRLSWSEPLPLRGSPVEGGYRFTVATPAPFELSLQLSFKDDRVLATRAADAAREAEKAGRLGECMRGWGELLSKWPFEEALVKEAEASRARLAQRGQEAVGAIEADLERADFFALEELYLQCEQKARALVDAYAGSELGLLAQAAAERAANSARTAGRGMRGTDIERLRAIRIALPAQGRLAALLDEALRQAPPEGGS
ncbi:MAG: FHA domain-containing protein [Planctomycetes bacterium]|nr:FHA domain-containing protein [Planctomycetota bacterium]